MRDDQLPAEESTGDDTEPNPAGEIRLSPARAIGLKVTALGGLAMGALITAAEHIPHTTSAP
ncbi:hypothetical protein BLA60_18765 [Actinophytocola xinjiangensis]|uniref:Uncharacterized protein n=1 Tax=Actinophytocola xinjiangensis TaxID=485602 RepID=A0A7Z0WL06_9PSEU|nr:hypothetical protein [Actinophytocola xinjiangensis]OLF09812.1 hypothetical protein BLA60_18765 [Actinophytocola xinjiangensis]